VLTEDSLDVMLQELDTVGDLTSYLRAKEDLVQGCKKVVLHGSENDLLAMYLTAGGQLPTSYDVVIVDDDIWAGLVCRHEYQAKKEADRDSYVCDRIVDWFAEHVLHGRLEFGAKLDQNERGIRVMARENRFARRILGKAFKEFFEFARDNQVRARMVRSPSGVVYVFMARPHGHPREARLAELVNRCFVGGGLHPDGSTVVGIATEQYAPSKGHSLDLVHLHVPQWTVEQQECMERMQAEMGYFTQPQHRWSSEDEYPKATGPTSSA